MKTNKITNYALSLLFIAVTTRYTQAQTTYDLYPQIVGAVNFNSSTGIASFNLNIQNGTANDPAQTFTVAYFVSSDSIYDNKDVQFSSLDITQQMMALGGGYYPTSVGCQLNVPGKWYIIVVVDVNNVVAETDEKNNIKSSSAIIVGSGTTEINDGYGLSNNTLQLFPNPVCYGTYFRFYLQESEFTTITIVDVTGKTVFSLAAEKLPAGVYAYDLKNNNLHAGIYFLHITTETGKYNALKKFVKTNVR